MPNTINSYMVTDLGNVSPNPRGEYNATLDYEYLDLVYYKGGSYVCLAPLGETIANVAPIAGQTTTNWQCVVIPGDITPEYISMYNEVVKDYNETNTNTANVAQMKDSAYASMTAAQESENKAGASEISARASEVSAKQSMDKAKEYADDAMRSNNDTQELVSGFDERVATAVSNAEASISESTENAKDEIIAQKSSSLNEFRTDAETVMTNEKNVAVAEIHNIVDDFDIATDAKEQEVIALANEKIDVMTALKSDTVNAKNSAETATTTAVEKAEEAAASADNAKSSENAVTEMKISIEQSQSDVQIKQIQVSSDAQQVSSDKSDILIMKSSIEDTAEKVDIDVQNGLQQILDSKDDSLSDIQNKKNEVIADIEQYGALQVSNEEPTSENVDLWINPDNEEEYSVPEIKDGEVNASDTWSSEKIFGEISELKSDLGELSKVVTPICQYIKSAELQNGGYIQSGNKVNFVENESSRAIKIHNLYAGKYLLKCALTDNSFIVVGDTVTKLSTYLGVTGIQQNLNITVQNTFDLYITNYTSYANGNMLVNDNVLPSMYVEGVYKAKYGDLDTRILENKRISEIALNKIEFIADLHTQYIRSADTKDGILYNISNGKVVEVENSQFASNKVTLDVGTYLVKYALTDYSWVESNGTVTKLADFLGKTGIQNNFSVEFTTTTTIYISNYKSFATGNMIVDAKEMPASYVEGAYGFSLKNYNNDVSKLSGKKVNFLGDSFTAGNGNYHEYIASRTGMIYRNYGVIGSTISEYDNEYSDDFIKRYDSMDNDCDMVVIFGGINDAEVLGTNQITLGTIESTDTNTFYGALKYLSECLITKFPTKPIVALLPPHINPNSGDHRSENIDTICNAEIEVYTKYGIPYFDLRSNSTISTLSPHISKYNRSSTDIHWNTNAHKRASYGIQKFLEQYIEY